MRIRNRKLPPESEASHPSPRPIRVPTRPKGNLNASIPISHRRSDSLNGSLPFLTDADSADPSSQRHQSRVQHSTQDSPSGPSQSTPLAVPRRLTRNTSQQPGPPVKEQPPVRQYSPLPPSSPPPASSFDPAFDAPPPPPDLDQEAQSQDVLEDEDKENVATSQPLVTPLERSPEGSDEDLFGMLALEKKLKAQREKEKHIPTASSSNIKGKQVALATRREPLGILAVAPDEDEDEDGSSLPLPPPQFQDLLPYRSDDDDLYAELDPEPEVNKDSAPENPDTHQAIPDPDEDEESENMLPQAPQIPYMTSDILPEQPKTPHVSHIDKRRLPMSSPFSSRSTPCDRTLAVESTPSSPSPTKPLTVVRPLRHPNIKRIKYPLPSKSPSAIPSTSPKRKADDVPETVKKKPRITMKKNGKEVDPEISGGKKLESLVPLKKSEPLRRSTRTSLAAKENKANPGQTRGPAKGKGKAVESEIFDEDDEVASEGESSSTEEEMVKPKKRGRPKGKQPTKKVKTSSPSKPASATGRRRGRPPKNAKPLSEKARGKQKATTNGNALSDEDEVSRVF